MTPLGKTLLSLSIMSLLLSPVFASDRIEIDRQWRTQPALNSTTMPIEADWSVTFAGQPRSIGNNRKGLSWAEQKWTDINSVWLTTPFTVPETWAERRIRLDFDRINGNLIVFVNGQRVGERLGPYGSIEITGFAKPGVNELLLFATRDYTDISRQFATDPMRNTARDNLKMSSWALGVDAPVYLVGLPRPVAIADSWTETSVRENRLTVQSILDVDALATIPDQLQLTCVIRDADKQIVKNFSTAITKLTPGKNQRSCSVEWTDPHYWELDDGYCYSAELKLTTADTVIDSDQFEFGFREIWTEGRNLMLNGHVTRFRVEWSSFGLSENSLPFFKLLGRNMVYYQSNPTAWYRDWAEVPYYNERELSMLDRAGIAVLLPVPTVNHVRDNLLKNPELQADFSTEMDLFIQRYRRHPAILAWCVSMNSFNPKDGIHPDVLGVRSNYTHIQAKVLDYTFDIVKKYDPTRLVYGHADGNLGDIASGNVYPNFAPLQEVEDWPELYAKNGNMPWWACEYAAVYNGSYWKGTQFLLTEFGAINFGQDAYIKETDQQLAATLDYSIDRRRRHGSLISSIASNIPLYWDIQRAYVKATDRAWRTWGVLGWHYFNFSVGYGQPEDLKADKPFGRYAGLKTPVTSRPDWANPQFDFHAEYMQRLLTYIAGYPDFTDKTHSFFAGDQVNKQIVVVWDGPGKVDLTADWQVVNSAKIVLAKDSVKIHANNGDILFVPISFNAPDTAIRQEYEIQLTVTGGPNGVVNDTFAIQVFPVLGTMIKNAGLGSSGENTPRWLLFDPSGKSAWVKTLIPAITNYNSNDKLNNNDILVIGREALTIGTDLPFDAATLRNGLTVIILEQTPAVWEALGFRNIEPGTRTLFPGVQVGTNSGLMSGLDNSALSYWQGTPDLTPQFRHTRAYDDTIAPKSSNRNVVASTIMEIPTAVGFVPLLLGEFDLGYSPLLRYKDQNGTIYFSSLDFTNRVGTDAAATRLAVNLLNLAATAKTAPADPKTVVYVNLSQEELAQHKLATTEKKLRRAALPAADSFFAKIAQQNLLRWRDELTVKAIDGGESDGIFFLRNTPEQREIFVQVSDSLLRGRYDDPDKDEAVRLSVLRLEQLVNQIRTMANENPQPGTTERLLKVRQGAAFTDLDSWTVFGPFKVAGVKPDKALKQKYPGEEFALSGDLNPNNTWTNESGTQLDFRTQINATKHFNDLAQGLKPPYAEALGFAVKEIHSDSDREAILRFGVDYWCHLYVNGELAFAVEEGHSSPNPNKFRVKIKLRKGINILTMKVISGSKGFGFWANLSETDNVEDDATSEQPELLYDTTLQFRNPYQYHYW